MQKKAGGISSNAEAFCQLLNDHTILFLWMDYRYMDDIKDSLLRKAELLMELREYQVEDLKHSEEAVDIKVSKPNSEKEVLIHIVTKSNLRSNGVSVDKVREVEKLEENVNKIIVFGERFTQAAKKLLIDQGIEFYGRDQRIVSSLNLQELYIKARDCVDTLCQIKCGHIPESETECEGFCEGSTNCSYCGGSGKLAGVYQEYKCLICDGTGLKEKHYSCEIRLISDNLYFHFEHGWLTLLRNDILSLLKILRSLKGDYKKRVPLLVTESKRAKS